ncbi:MAG TPA: TadE/TadG family type IV pilus assembly protein [Solirubrobacteraceae bacterium]|nr:TadE/TadG family type IV pilus assembly protein [Solirubrobacteraceae bacterium]
MRRLRRAHRDQRGQASVEFAGVLVWLLLAALFVWQLMLVTWAFNQASNAARTASRVDGRGGDAVKAGREALSKGLRDGARIRMEGERAVVRVRIPILLPGLDSDDMVAERKAELPG